MKSTPSQSIPNEIVDANDSYVKALQEIKLDKSSPKPLHRQLSEALTCIISTLPPTTKLPTIRNLAKFLGINNTTVVTAYKNLEAKGAVYSVVGSGIYVSANSGKNPHEQITILNENSINFAGTSTNTSYFPVDAFRQACDQVLIRDGGKAFNEPDPKGYEPLRQIISTEMNTSAENIQIIPGINLAIETLANKFINPGDVVLVESPGSQAVAAIFMSRGARVIAFPRGVRGIEKLQNILKQFNPKFIYTMPNFQIPTGLCYTEKEKQHMLELTARADSYIIEADILSDLYYDGNPRLTMKAQDIDNRVIYLKSYSRILTPGLKMGYIIFPEVLTKLTELTKLEAEEIIWREAPSGYMQRVFDFYLRHGGFSEHGAYIRSQYGKRYHKLVNACETYLEPYASFTAPGGGLGLWIKPNKSEINFENLLRRQVIVSPGRLFSPTGGNISHFHINFANVPKTRVAEGIGIIASELARR